MLIIPLDHQFSVQQVFALWKSKIFSSLKLSNFAGWKNRYNSIPLCGTQLSILSIIGMSGASKNMRNPVHLYANICVSFWLLAYESFKSWPNLQNDNNFHSKWWFCSKILVEWKKFTCSVCNNTYFLPQLEINHLTHEPTVKKLTQM